MKKILKVLLIVIVAIALLAGSYVAYLLIAYHRLGDMDLQPGGTPAAETLPADGSYRIVSYNIGFGAYEADYDFFMDGGKQSWAWSKSRLNANLSNIAALLSGQDADFYFVQEVDIGSTRSYHVDEREYLTDGLPSYGYAFAQNYDSPFLCYPFYQPHGASRSGIMTFSKYTVTAASRVGLPVEKGLTRFLDLDRCYSKSRVPLSDGKELVLYNFHLSAYTTDGTIADEQLKKLLDDINEEYAAGNYCIAGGDFNKDILGNSAAYFGRSDKEYTWAQPIPEGLLEQYPVSLVAPLDANDPIPSCRNADAPYHEGQYVVTIDGFLVTDNIRVDGSEVIDTAFAYSDHNPVKMSFSFVR